MQKFYLSFTYKTPDGDTRTGESWCKKDTDALSRIHLKLPAQCQLWEAWLVEWQNPDAPMEPLFGGKAQPDDRLKEMLCAHRNSKLATVLTKMKNSKPRVRLKNTSPPPVPKEKKKEYCPFVLYYALSYRDNHWSNK